MPFELRSAVTPRLTRVCSGSVGAVLALEASRLARNDRDWSQLVELGAISNVVLIDHDGIYDPRAINDRLLLGLKGIMSEFEELGSIRQVRSGSRTTIVDGRARRTSGHDKPIDEWEVLIQDHHPGYIESHLIPMRTGLRDCIRHRRA